MVKAGAGALPSKVTLFPFLRIPVGAGVLFIATAGAGVGGCAAALKLEKKKDMSAF